MTVSILIGDCRAVLKTLPASSVDSCVTDPPYHLTSIIKRFGAANAAPAKVKETGVYARASAGFMGQTWDGGDVAFRPETWAEVLRVLKPGGHLLAFSGARTYHRLVCAIEDAGFEIRDQIMWLYGSGFPKSHDVSKGIDKAVGAERVVIGEQKLAGTARIKGGSGYTVESAANNYASAEIRNSIPITSAGSPQAAEWEGWGTALKPAHEPIVLARKPLIGTVAANVLAHGTGALNIDGCRIEGQWTGSPSRQAENITGGNFAGGNGKGRANLIESQHSLGRWPANVILSYPEDEYLLRHDVGREQKTALYRWMSENA